RAVMGRRARCALKDAILRSRLPFKGAIARVYLRSAERYRTMRAGPSPEVDERGLALPSARLRVLVAGTGDAEMFLRSGEVQADYLRDLAERAAQPLER